MVARIELRVLDEKLNSQSRCDNGEQYAIGDWTKGRVSTAILQEKDRMKENAKKIRTVWRKQGSTQHTRRMHATSHRSLPNDRKRML